ncbi:hypothetical protein, partial [Kluyvera intermedia]|uniref:hypothetical protein n=1 Tax=Kluyvera intermedia TaxID=61648 RepID=UPI003B9F4073
GYIVHICSPAKRSAAGKSRCLLGEEPIPTAHQHRKHRWATLCIFIARPSAAPPGNLDVYSAQNQYPQLTSTVSIAGPHCAYL